MWNNWSDVTKKLKEIAADITTPQYENYNRHDSKGKEEAEETRRIRSNNEDGSLLPPCGGVVRRLYHEQEHTRHKSPVVPTRSVALASGAIPPTRPTFHSKAPEAIGGPIRNAASRSVEDGHMSTKQNGEEESVITQSNSTGVSTHSKGDTKASATVPSGWTESGSRQDGDEIIGLKEQVRQLLDEKQLMESQILAYREEVKDEHDRLVSHYEGLIQSLRGESSIDKTKSEQLTLELENRDKECEALKAQLHQMRLHVEDLEAAAVTSAASCESACALLTGRIKELEQQLEDHLNKSGEQKDLTPITKETPSLDTQTEYTGTTLSPGPQHVGVDESEEFGFLRHLVESLEVTPPVGAHTKDELALLLKEELRTHREASMEKETLISQNREQAQRLSELINMLEGDQECRKAKLEENTAALQNEINILHSQLEATKEEATKAADKERERVRKELESLTTELESFRRVNLEGCNAREALVAELEEVRSNTAAVISEAASREANLTAKLSAADGMVEQLRSEVANIKRSSDQRESEESNVAALAVRRRELETELAHQQGLLQQLEHTVTDCLVRAEVELPSSINANGVSGKGKNGGNVTSSFSDKIIILVSEFNRLFGASQQADKLEKEWEYTYEQARSVNAALNQQISESWKIIGSLREELSVSEQTLSKAQQQLQAETQQHNSALQTITIITNEVQALKEEKYAWETRVLESTNGAADHETRLVEMAADMDSIRAALQDREEELTQAQRALENLQQVLDTFKLNKSRDVESRTADMQMEIDNIKAQLAEVHQLQEKHLVEKEELNTAHRKEIATKNVEIMSFHRKHAELRKALEETARQLNGDTIIDKRVISHLVVNYIHAFVAQRPEANEMLKVLSGLLNWDEAMQEKAGLLPGPSNPKPGQQGRRGIIGGFVSTVWGKPREPRSGIDGAVGGGNAVRERSSLAELWVEFLMRESETATVSYDDITSLPVETTEGVEETDAKQNPA